MKSAKKSGSDKNFSVLAMSEWSRRKYRRFVFRYQIKVTFCDTGREVRLDAVTKNVSAGGVLFESSVPIPKHSAVSFTIVAEGKAVIHPIEFSSEGKVVRVESCSTRAQYRIALECARPVQFHPFVPKDNCDTSALTTS
jgi:hypothetical protein